MEQKKPYQPTEEEIKKAEGMMDRKQKLMSGMRERDINSHGSHGIFDKPSLKDQKELIQKMKSGEYNLKLKTGPMIDKENLPIKMGRSNYDGGVLSGKIGDHQVELYLSEWGTIPTTVTGFVDGKKITEEYAKELYSKYASVGRLQQSDSKNYTEVADAAIAVEDEKEAKRKYWADEDATKAREKEREEKEKQAKSEREKYKL